MYLGLLPFHVISTLKVHNFQLFFRKGNFEDSLIINFIKDVCGLVEINKPYKISLKTKVKKERDCIPETKQYVTRIFVGSKW